MHTSKQLIKAATVPLMTWEYTCCYSLTVHCVLVYALTTSCHQSTAVSSVGQILCHAGALLSAEGQSACTHHSSLPASGPPSLSHQCFLLASTGPWWGEASVHANCIEYLTLKKHSNALHSKSILWRHKLEQRYPQPRDGVRCCCGCLWLES